MNHVISSDGTTIAFDRSGEGPPVILVGGALSDRSAAAPLAEALAPRFTVFAYDRRGRGGSGDMPPYAVEREVEDIGALLAEAGGSACAFGHSSGAVLALEGAARGLPITKLALYEPPFIVDDSRPATPPDFVARLTELVAAGRRGDAVEYFMTTGPGVPADMIAGMRTEPYWAAMEELAHTLPYDGTIMGDTLGGKPLPTERWTLATMPVLVIDGGASPRWARDSVQALAEILPRAEHRTLDGQTHGFDPAAIAPVLEAFFS